MTKEDNSIKLSDAVKVVNEAIKKETERLEKIAKEDDQRPVMVEGETFEGYYCQLMVNPKDVARIFLRHGYPTCVVLQDDAPDEMWNELGRKFGILGGFMSTKKDPYWSI